MRIKAILEAKGITQRQLADMIGISQHSLSEKMRGMRDFTWSEISAICGILDVPPCTLVL